MKCPAIIAVVFLTAGSALAQTEGAGLSGRVTDPTGAVIVAAECKITNIETNVSMTTTTNEDGIYVVPDLRPATYRPAWGRAGTAIMKGWAVDGLLRVSSAWPINVTIVEFSPAFGPYSTQPDIVPGQPYWLAAPTQPVGKVLNPAAFTPPPVGQTGNFPRDGLRGVFSLHQTDLALRRRFNLTERVKLDIRAEYFNVFNHPMFGAPGIDVGSNYYLGVRHYSEPAFRRDLPHM